MISIAIDAVLMVHGLFILYVLLGGLMVFYRKGLVWPHLLTIAWGIWIELFAGTCPLTLLEWKLRAAAGMQQYQGGFIDHYLTAAIYPSGLSRETQHWIGLFLICWSVGVYAMVIRHWRRRTPPAGCDSRTPLSRARAISRQ
jgi:hypothetical protein